MRHGEAVAIGMALDARYSVLAGLLADGEDARICALLEHLGFRLWHPALEIRGPTAALRSSRACASSVEHLGGDLTVTLLEDIGSGIEVHAIDETRMLAAIDWLKERAQSP